MATAAPPDAGLVDRAQRGDVSAFEELVRRHHGRVHAVALRVTSNTADADDCTQEAFLRAWRALPSFRAESRFSTWMYRIVTNVALNHVSRRRERPSGDVPETPDPTGGPERRSIGRERVDVVTTALDALTAEQRATFVLRDVEGLSYEEAAEALGTTVSAVKSRLFRARQQVAAALQAYDAPSGVALSSAGGGG